MGMSMHVVGFRPIDDAWRKQKSVWDACIAAGVEIPKETRDFFDNRKPDPSGHEVDIEPAQKEWRDEYRQGIEVNIDDLPTGLRVIRFYVSW